MVFRGDGEWSDGYIQRHSKERLLLIAAENARKALTAGITTLRDLGSPGRLLFELRDAVDAGDIRGPRLLLSGPPLTTTGGHGWDLGGEVDSVREIVKMIRTLARDGADVIKVMASGGGTSGTSPGFPAFSLDELHLMTRAAHERGLPIVAHATCPDAVRDCALAGFDGVEHAGFWVGEQLVNRFSDEVAALLVKHKMFVAPTLQASYRTLHEMENQTPLQKERRKQLVDDAFSNFREMLGYDIAWVAGTDAGYMINPFGDLPFGLQLMVQNGMDSADALASATVNSAAALGKKGEIGELIPGAMADIVVVEENPLDNIQALKYVHAVYLDGQRVA
jgi:imidazolonepropionase-like amidohydrolase